MFLRRVINWKVRVVLFVALMLFSTWLSYWYVRQAFDSAGDTRFLFLPISIAVTWQFGARPFRFVIRWLVPLLIAASLAFLAARAEWLATSYVRSPNHGTLYDCWACYLLFFVAALIWIIAIPLEQGAKRLGEIPVRRLRIWRPLFACIGAAVLLVACFFASKTLPEPPAASIQSLGRITIWLEIAFTLLAFIRVILPIASSGGDDRPVSERFSWGLPKH